MRRLFAVCALVALGGCRAERATAPTAPLAGHWLGPVNASVVQLVLVDSGGVVSGGGSIATTVQRDSVLATGTYSPPNISLQLVPLTGSAWTLSGLVTETSISAVLSGGQLAYPMPVILVRAP